jgi:hypothetical protein
MTASDVTRQPPSATSGEGRDDRVDAIRFAVLRKLAPGLRHALMGELQGLQLSAEFASRALRAGADLAEVRDHVDRMPQQCSAAIKTGRAVIEWMQPGQGTTAVGEGIAQCLKLAGEDWFLRGVVATMDVPDRDIHVATGALRELVVTALLVLTDRFDRPADFRVAARRVEDHVDVVLEARAAARAASFTPANPYRTLGWADLKALADAHGVACACEGDTAALQFRCAKMG